MNAERRTGHHFCSTLCLFPPTTGLFCKTPVVLSPRDSPRNADPTASKSRCPSVTMILVPRGNFSLRDHPTDRPTTNGDMQKGSSVGIHTHCMHVFARLASTCMLSRCLVTKFLQRSSGGSLLRVRCWLGVNGAGEDNSGLPANANAVFLRQWVRLHFRMGVPVGSPMDCPNG